MDPSGLITVDDGDTLWGIFDEYNSNNGTVYSVDEIAELNSIPVDEDGFALIHPGQEILIPKEIQEAFSFIEEGEISEIDILAIADTTKQINELIRNNDWRTLPVAGQLIQPPSGQLNRPGANER